MGGASTEIDASTTDIVLESAHFDAISVAYTARRHRLPSEASRRFERGVDDALAPVAADAALQLFTRPGGAKSAAAGQHEGPRPARPPVSDKPCVPSPPAG